MWGMKKKKDKELKLNEKDVGFAEDYFEMMKHAVSRESHLLGNYIISKKKEDLILLDRARNQRTKLMEVILKVFNVELQNQNWCCFKHICGTAMVCQELITRASTIKMYDIADELAEIHKQLYLDYLTLLGFNEGNLSNTTSA